MLPQSIKIITQRYGEIKVLTSVTRRSFEIHTDEGNQQRSILLKLFIARCINSAVLIFIATKYKDTFGLDSLQQIQNILIADAIATPVFRLLNVYDFFMRYVAAPYIAHTQDDYNAIWQGADWTLAERYTDMLKSLFLGLFFAVPLPSGLFITCFAMLNTYFVDKFSLFRLWKRPPQFSKQLAVTSRYFYLLIVWSHLNISRIYFANWPFRGLFGQDKGERASCDFVVCDTNSDMTEDQEEVVDIYSNANLIVLVVIAAYAVYLIIRRILRLCFSKIHSTGDASSISFRDVVGIYGYIPIVRRNELTTAIICCDIQRIPLRFIPIRNLNTWDSEPMDPQVM